MLAQTLSRLVACHASHNYTPTGLLFLSHGHVCTCSVTSYNWSGQFWLVVDCTTAGMVHLTHSYSYSGKCAGSNDHHTHRPSDTWRHPQHHRTHMQGHNHTPQITLLVCCGFTALPRLSIHGTNQSQNKLTFTPNHTLVDTPCIPSPAKQEPSPALPPDRCLVT